MVLGARNQDSEGSGSWNNKNQDIWRQNNPSEGFCSRKLQKEEEICKILLARARFLLFLLVLAEVDINTGNEGMFVPKRYALAEDDLAT